MPKFIKQSQPYNKPKPPRKRIQNKWFNEEWEYFSKHEKSSKRSWMAWEYDSYREPMCSWNYANRWIVKQVGRRWNDVYSEICRTIPKQYRKVFFWNITVNVKWVNGELRNADDLSWKVSTDCYVDPDTGIIKKI